MIEDDEKHVESPELGDIWDLDGVHQLVVLNVDKHNIEYCDKKILHGPGIWEWDLVKYLTMPKKSLKRYVCEPVPLSEKPMDFRMQFNTVENGMQSVRTHYRRLNRHLHEGPDIVVIEKDGIMLSFERAGDGVAKLSDGESEIELSVFTLWMLGDEAYEQGEL